MQMLIQPYDPAWVTQFDLLKEILAAAIRESVAIEHVGSTAVPDLAAKPIIDIDISFKTPAAFESIKKDLEQLGYYHNGNQGIMDREVFKRTAIGPSHAILDHIAHHLYVCPIESKELQNTLHSGTTSGPMKKQSWSTSNLSTGLRKRPVRTGKNMRC